MTHPDLPTADLPAALPAAVSAAAHVNAGQTGTSPIAGAALGAADRQRAKNTARGPIFPTSVPWIAVAVYVAIAFGGAWLVALPMWTSGDGLGHPLFGVLTPAMMFTPALATLVVVLFVRRPPSIPRYLGMSPMRPAGRTWLFIALAFVVFTALPFLAMLLGHAMGLLRLDLGGLSGVQAAIEAAGGTGGMDASTVLALNLAVLPLITLVNCVATFGEEIGWRGWLLPSLRPLGTVWALLLSGVIWGLWHAPLILLGYNYQRTDVLGVLSMVAFCVLTGFVIGWMRLRSASVWPAVVAHAAINTATSQFLLLADASSLADPAGVWGSVLGWPGWILLAVVSVVIVVTGQLRKQPQPGLTLAESRAVV